MNHSDFIDIQIENEVATIWLDHKTEKMNVVSPKLISVFNEVFDQLFNNDTVKAVVIISKKKDFIAGADIKSFVAEKEGDFRPIQTAGHEALLRIEQSKKPVVAAIHGTAYGLGTELPLACHARVCSDDSSTKFALPEVKLGLLPGGGGTQRLPKLVGVQKALDMMLTGKNIYAYQAKKMGLVDEVTNKFKLHSVAVQMAKKLINQPIQRKRKNGLVNGFLDNTSVGRNIVFSQAKKLSAKQTQGNYPAVPAIIECVETGLKKGNKEGYEKELVLFEKLMIGQVSKELRQLFFNMTDNKKNPYKNEHQIALNKLGMLGAGFMGAGITEVSINKGIQVLLKDIKSEPIEHAKAEIWKSIAKKIKYKTISKPQAEEIMQRVDGRTDYRDFDQTDIVIEAIVEKMEVKKAVITELEKHIKSDCIIASNTSSLSVSEMANHSQKPEHFIGMHYFSPVPKMPLLEIVKTPKTAEWVISACYEMGLKQGKTVIVVNDGPGFYVNRILAPYLNECLLMADEGIALDVIDRAMIKKGFPVGPISLLDEVGLDIAAHVAESAKASLINGREGFVASDATTRMFKDGRLGKKNKKGFYNYVEKGGRTKKAGIDSSAYIYFNGKGDKTLAVEEIQNRAIMLMLNEAAMCLEEGIIANPTDGDLGAVFGIGFLPFTGGPFRYMDYLGINKVVETLNNLEAKYGPKFKARPILQEMQKSNSKFHS